MKNKSNMMGIALSALLLLSGCSMWSGDDNAAQGTANATDTKQPENNRNVTSEDSIDNMMNYLKQQGVEISDMAPIDKMDFAAHEGKSFTYQGNTAYLYRLKSDDVNMKALLDEAKQKGNIKVNHNGKEELYNASVNGDYLFVYEKDADMGSFINAMGSYVPGATTTTPNNGGAPTQIPNTASGSETNTENKDSGQTPQTNTNEIED